MSNIKYKVGDRVVVKSLAWYNENKDANGNVNVPCTFVSGMSSYCGKVVTIRHKGSVSYFIEDSWGYSWTDEMFEGLAEERCVFFKTKDVKDLPKDFDECVKIVGINDGVLLCSSDVREMEVEKLRICRDAYWRLADGWKPDWKKNTKKHCVVIRDGRVGVATTISKQRKFAFPTPEMADAFGKNFKKELEACKEVLENKWRRERTEASWKAWQEADRELTIPVAEVMEYLIGK
jgi:hypothetical protein